MPAGASSSPIVCFKASTRGLVHEASGEHWPRGWSRVGWLFLRRVPRVPSIWLAGGVGSNCAGDNACEWLRLRSGTGAASIRRDAGDDASADGGDGGDRTRRCARGRCPTDAAPIVNRPHVVRVRDEDCGTDEACIGGICRDGSPVARSRTISREGWARPAQRCVLAEVDPCAGIECESDTTCFGGACVPGRFPELCDDVLCEAGEFCDPVVRTVRVLADDCDATHSGRGPYAILSVCRPISDDDDAGRAVPRRHLLSGHVCADIVCTGTSICIINGECFDTCECESGCEAGARCVRTCECELECSRRRGLWRAGRLWRHAAGRGDRGSRARSQPGVRRGCDRDCSAKNCGEDDGCGRACEGPCPGGGECIDGACCVPDLAPSTESWRSRRRMWGHLLLICPDGLSCTLASGDWGCRCAPSCTYTKLRQNDGCGGTRWEPTARGAQLSVRLGSYQCACAPNCTGKRCGDDDGCGRQCYQSCATFGGCLRIWGGSAGYACCTPSCGSAFRGAADGCAEHAQGSARRAFRARVPVARMPVCVTQAVAVPLVGRAMAAVSSADGSCAAGYDCQFSAGHYSCACQPSCDGKACGADNGCGTSVLSREVPGLHVQRRGCADR